jgi:hypothetical protein
MAKNSAANTLTPKEALMVFVLTLLIFPATLLWAYMGTIVWDRQHSVVILDRTKVFDQWDAFGLPKPQLIGEVEKGATLPVVARFRSIEGGGIRVRLADGRLANLVPFSSDGDYRLTNGFEPIGILIFAEVGTMLAWEWLFILGKKRLATRLLSAVILFPATLLTIVFMLRGLV